MTGENRIPEDPGEWLARAKSSLCLAGMDVEGVLYEDLCYQAQQAAEKAIKAVFISRNIPYPYIHSINTLITILENGGMTIPERIWNTSTLSVYATGTRYPGFEPVTRDEYLEAVRFAGEAVSWAEEIIGL